MDPFFVSNQICWISLRGLGVGAMSSSAKRSLLQRIQDRLRRRIKSLDFRFRRRFQLSTIRSLYGPRFHTNFGDATFRLYIKASYGFFYWDRLRSIDHDFVFIDVGANQGLYTLGAAFNPHSQGCHAFEPVPAVADLLSRNLELNGVSEKCRVSEVAISRDSGGATITLPENHTGGASIQKHPEESSTKTRTMEIETISRSGLDQLIRRDNFPVRIKVDVEGHEEVVIQELLASHFADRIEEIFYEVDERWVDPNRLQSSLRNLGFTLMKIGEGSHYDILAERVLKPLKG